MGGTGSVHETGAFITVTDIVLDLAPQESSGAFIVVVTLGPGNFILGTALCFSISLHARHILNWLEFWKSVSPK